MSGQAHVIDVDIRSVGFGQLNRVVAKLKIIDAVGAFCDGEKTLAVIAFDADHQTNFSVKFDGARIKGAVDAETLHEKRIGFGVKIVTPVQRCMLGSDNGILPAGVDAIADRFGGVRSGNQLMVTGGQQVEAAAEN